MTVTRNAVRLALVAAFAARCTAPDVMAPAADDHVRGPATAKVTLVEYGDYQCAPCAASHQAVEQVLARHPNDVRFIYRHHPSRKYRNAMVAARAAEAAEAQGKFWEMHRTLFEGQKEWYPESTPDKIFLQYANALQLDGQRFSDALRAKDMDRQIRATFEEGRRVGVHGSPAFFLNGKRLVPPPTTIEDLERAVSTALNQRSSQ